MNWETYLPQAYKTAMSSRDPSTQNGALIVESHGIVLAWAANNFPNGVLENDNRWERPRKYYYVEHAERNAVFTAARQGIMTKGTTMVCPWAACADCARAIVQAGITTLVRHEKSNDPETTNVRWDETIVAGDQILYEGGVEVIGVTPIAGYKLRRDGKLTDTADL